MERTPVKSGYIAAIGYDPATQTLEVEFKTGRLYRYFEFSPEKFAEMQAAESIGKYFNANCRALPFQAIANPEEEGASGSLLPKMHDKP